MGTVTPLRARRTTSTSRRDERTATCTQCGERHPIVRLADGSARCLTAFSDGERWFCRNRGCRAAWLARKSPAPG